MRCKTIRGQSYTFDAPEKYDTPRFDKLNNETVNSDFHSEGTTAEEGRFGDRQFASNRTDLHSTGYGPNMGLNVIEYGEGAAFDRASTVYVAVDRADRGKEQ